MKFLNFLFVVALMGLSGCGDSYTRPSILRNKQSKIFTEIKNAPPVVLSTSPQSGTLDANPDLKEITVTFSSEMQDNSWSWVQTSEESFPKTTGAPNYDSNKRTVKLPVQLSPNTTYIMWINQGSNLNFKGANGKSSIPYLLAFKTEK